MASLTDNTAQWDSATFDVTIICEGHRFRCHRVILAQGSDYFRALLLGPFRERDAADVELHEDNPDVLERLLRGLYGFPLTSASDTYFGLPAVAEIIASEDPAVPEVLPPRGRALVPWLQENIALYFVARKYLCERICMQLQEVDYMEWAIEAIVLDYFLAAEAAAAEADAETDAETDADAAPADSPDDRPTLSLVVTVLRPVYEVVPQRTDILRFLIAVAVYGSMVQEKFRRENYEPRLELHGPALVAALPELAADLGWRAVLGRPIKI